MHRFLICLLAACDPAAALLEVDADGDGWGEVWDCDDADPAVHPGATEVCGNDIDDDCDLAAIGCGLYGAFALSDEDAVTGTTAGVALGSVLVGGPTPAATAPGVGVLLLEEGTWIPGSSDGFGASLASVEGAVLAGDPEAGSVLLVGAESLTFSGDADERAGESVAFTGSSVVVGAPGAGSDQQGAVYVLHAPGSDRSLTDADAVISGELSGGQAGLAVLGGDYDGDGNSDLAVVGSPAPEEFPWAWVVLGPLEGSTSLADADARLTYWDTADTAALAGPCDVNGDGALELIASLSTRYENEWSTGWHFHSKHVAATGFDVVGGYSSTDDHPWQPACGDVNGDGLDEVAYANTRQGWIQIDSGEWSDIATAPIPEGEPATVAFAAGTDGYDSLLVGLPASDLGAEGAGAVWILPGGPGF